jgi:cytochrome b561
MQRNRRLPQLHRVCGLIVLNELLFRLLLPSLQPSERRQMQAFLFEFAAQSSIKSMMPQKLSINATRVQRHSVCA